MNRALQWKLIAGFLLVFVAGGITGAFVGGSYARHHFFELHHPERIGGRMKERLRAELNLTPEQLAKISPIIDKTTAQLRDIRRDTGQRVRQIIADAHRQMAAELTDEQRQKLKQIEERHRHWRHHRFHESFGRTAVAHTLIVVVCAVPAHFGRGVPQIPLGQHYRSEAHAVFEKNSFPLDVCATAEKKIAYFRRVVAAVVGGIESKKDFSARRQVML